MITRKNIIEIWCGLEDFQDCTFWSILRLVEGWSVSPASPSVLISVRWEGQRTPLELDYAALELPSILGAPCIPPGVFFGMCSPWQQLRADHDDAQSSPLGCICTSDP